MGSATFLPARGHQRREGKGSGSSIGSLSTLALAFEGCKAAAPRGQPAALPSRPRLSLAAGGLYLDSVASSLRFLMGGGATGSAALGPWQGIAAVSVRVASAARKAEAAVKWPAPYTTSLVGHRNQLPMESRGLPHPRASVGKATRNYSESRSCTVRLAALTAGDRRGGPAGV